VIKSEDDTTAIEDIANFTYNQFKDCLAFLEGLYVRRIDSACVEGNRHLALVAAFALEDRLNKIVAEFDGFDFFEDEFCDGGVSIMTPNDSRRKLYTVIRMILLKNCGGVLSNSAISSNALLKKAVCSRMGSDVLDHPCHIYSARKHLLDMYTTG
jgi:hypothetical protein